MLGADKIYLRKVYRAMIQQRGATQNLIDDGAGNNADGKSDAMTLGEIKGSKLDFGSPEKVAGVALSSTTLKSPTMTS